MLEDEKDLKNLKILTIKTMPINMVLWLSIQRYEWFKVETSEHNAAKPKICEYSNCTTNNWSKMPMIIHFHCFFYWWWCYEITKFIGTILFSFSHMREQHACDIYIYIWIKTHYILIRYMLYGKIKLKNAPQKYCSEQWI